MSKKVDTWMPLLVDKYLGDTQHLTTEQHGAYLLLLMAMWKRDGSLPVRDLPQISKLPPARWKACAPVLMEMFTPSDDGSCVTQKRLSQELERSKAHTEAKSKAGAKGAAKKWGKDVEADGKTDGTAIAQPLPSHWQTGASTPPPSATQIPDSASAESSRAPEPTAYGAICLAMRAAGYPATSPGDLKFRALVDAGCAESEFVEAAKAAIAHQPAKGLGWVLGRVENRRKEAASTAAGLRASKHAGFASKDYRKGIESDGTFTA